MKIKELFFMLTFTAVMLCADFCRGQFAPSISSSTVESAESRKLARQETGGGNIKLGPVEFTFAAGVKQEFNDNIGLSKVNRASDFITSPHASVGIRWPVTQLNTLNLNLGLGYSKYWSHSELDTSNLLVDPKSVFGFDFYIKDVHFNVHDRISIQQDPVAIAQLSNVGSFQRLTNTAGLSADWDLNKVKLNGGYDHQTFTSLDNRFSFLDANTDTIQGAAGLQIAPPYLVGVQGSYSRTEFDQGFQNGSRTYAMGLFGNAIFSEQLQGQGSVAYQSSSFDRGGGNGDNSDFGSFVCSASLVNQLNRWINHSISGSRSTSLGIASNFTEHQRVEYQIIADVIRDLTPTMTTFYQWSKDSGGGASENSTQFGFSLQVGYLFIKDTTVNVGYEYSQKDSSLSLNGYVQNRIFIDVNHTF